MAYMSRFPTFCVVFCLLITFFPLLSVACHMRASFPLAVPPFLCRFSHHIVPIFTPVFFFFLTFLFPFCLPLHLYSFCLFTFFFSSYILLRLIYLHSILLLPLSISSPSVSCKNRSCLYTASIPPFFSAVTSESFMKSRSALAETASSSQEVSGVTAASATAATDGGNSTAEF